MFSQNSREANMVSSEKAKGQKYDEKKERK